MFVYPIYEDNHGLLGIAKDYKSAVQFLIKEDWLEDGTEVWVEGETNTYDSLKHYLGEDWADIMTENWTREEFNDFWRDSFTIDKEILIEKTS